VTVAEANEAFCGLDMGNTGKPGRIVPEDDFLKCKRQEDLSEGEGTTDFDSKYVISRLKKPCIDLRWHLDYEKPAYESRTIARSYFQESPSTSNRLDQVNKAKRTSQQKANRNTESIESRNFTNRSKDGSGAMERTVFGALMELGKTNKKYEKSMFPREGSIRYLSRPHDLYRSRHNGSTSCTAPWGITHKLCYNVSIDMHDYTGNGSCRKNNDSPDQHQLGNDPGNNLNLAQMDYRELQQMAKKYGIKANLKYKKLLNVLTHRI
jgi:hypothetical protein